MDMEFGDYHDNAAVLALALRCIKNGDVQKGPALSFGFKTTSFGLEK